MSKATIHPDWCGRSHLCSHERTGGEHRSAPISVDIHDTRLVITRIRARSGSDRMEIRAVVDLPADPETARRYALAFLGRLHRAIATHSMRSRP